MPPPPIRTHYHDSKLASFCSFSLLRSGEVTNTNCMVIGLTRWGLQPTIYSTRYEHANLTPTMRFVLRPTANIYIDCPWKYRYQRRIYIQLSNLNTSNVCVCKDLKTSNSIAFYNCHYFL